VEIAGLEKQRNILNQKLPSLPASKISPATFICPAELIAIEIKLK